MNTFQRASSLGHLYALVQFFKVIFKRWHSIVTLVFFDIAYVFIHMFITRTTHVLSLKPLIALALCVIC